MSVNSSINEGKNTASLSVSVTTLEEYEEIRDMIRDIRFYRAVAGSEKFGDLYTDFENNIDAVLSKFEEKNPHLITAAHELKLNNAKKENAKNFIPMVLLFNFAAVIFLFAMEYMNTPSKIAGLLVLLGIFVSIFRCYANVKEIKNQNK